MKLCRTCGQTKSATEFHKDTKGLDGLRFQCKQCVREYTQTPARKASRARYSTSDKAKLARARFRQVHRDEIRAYDAKRDQAVRVRIDAIKLERGCIDCGYRAAACALDFDHRDPTSKTMEISRNLGRRWASIEAEIALCDVRCANCHRVRSFTENHHRLSRSEMA